jgi:hypothetical protein
MSWKAGLPLLAVYAVLSAVLRVLSSLMVSRFEQSKIILARFKPCCSVLAWSSSLKNNVYSFHQRFFPKQEVQRLIPWKSLNLNFTFP